MIISSNTYLTKAKGKDNAQFIMNFFKAAGWSRNAVCAMLGNISVESTVNPGLWEGRVEFRYNKGFGLTQWTPATKYIDWAALNGAGTYELYKQLDPQCSRILWEVTNGDQWQSGIMTFAEYSVSNLSIPYLSDRFCYGYERPGNPDLVTRRANGLYWYKNLIWNAVKKSNFFMLLGKPQIY